MGTAKWKSSSDLGRRGDEWACLGSRPVPSAIKIFAGKKALQLDSFLGHEGAVHRPHTGLHVFHRRIYERIRVFLAGSSFFLLWFAESRRRIREQK
jgi:hypothetical protein